MTKDTEGHGTALAWLLEPDEINPGVRYFALRDLLHRPSSSPELIDAQRSIMRTGPVPAILDAQSPEGYWVKPGAGYSPKIQQYHPTRGLLGPGFVCSCNSGLPCAWGAVRALWALARVPLEERTPEVEAAIRACARFLLSYSVVRADYPADHSISPRWFEFGYPLAYITDVLLNLEALTEAGYAHDPRLGPAMILVKSKRNDADRWKMELTYRGRMWVNVEKKGKPSKWVTLRALRVFGWVERNGSERSRSQSKDQKP